MSSKERPLFQSLRGFGAASLAQDLTAGVTLAAIAIPEQMATAHLGHFPPEIGFLAFIAGALGFAVCGASRYLSAGADSTITPIFAGGLVLLAATGSPAYAALAALLALMVGIVVAVAGWLRMGWISSLLSVPVTSGFLAGISVHILASQLPAVLGLPAGSAELLSRFAYLFSNIGHANLYTLALGLGVFAITFGGEKLNSRIPCALIGVALAATAAFLFGLQQRGVPVLGRIGLPLPSLRFSAIGLQDVFHLAPLAFLIALVVMVQTAATTRSFPSELETAPDVDRDFVGVGMGSIIAGLVGAFPVNASPPRTAISVQTGARTQMTGLFAAILVGTLAAFGSGLLAYVPDAALAGVLLFVAQRILQLHLFRTVLRESRGEFALILATAAAIVILPIDEGVALGVLLSLLHGIWTATRARLVEFERVPGTSIWWPANKDIAGEKLPGVLVVAFQAPLSFLNADDFRRGFSAAIGHAQAPLALVVLEASSIVEIDFTAARVLEEAIRRARSAGAIFAVARLESVRAQEALERFGITALVGRGFIYRSVAQAVEALLPAGGPPQRQLG